MRLVFTLILAVILPALANAQQSPVPERYISLIEDMDLPGADLRPMFDTTFNACEAACLSDPQCVAFTYNQRSAACFPKSAVPAPEGYQGALSAIVHETDPSVLAGLPTRLADLDFIDTWDLSEARELAHALASHHYAGLHGAERLLLQAFLL